MKENDLSYKELVKNWQLLSLKGSALADTKYALMSRTPQNWWNSETGISTWQIDPAYQSQKLEHLPSEVESGPRTTV